MTREDLLKSLKRSGVGERVLAAMAAVPREDFVPSESASHAWDDCALPLASGSTISQPAMVAVVLEELRLEPGLRVLEVGSGSGYLLALIHAMGAEVVGIEIDPNLAQESRRRLPNAVEVIEGDASVADRKPPYDRIVFSAALTAVPTWAIDDQTPNGFCLAPVGLGAVQELERAFRDGRRERTGRLCRFVPFR